jgi:hypothetical protein
MAAVVPVVITPAVMKAALVNVSETRTIELPVCRDYHHPVSRGEM